MPAAKKWSQDVTEHSDALDLERDIFSRDDPKAIARSLKKSAEASHRRKSSPYRSAMSMLTFYINRAGKGLGEKQRRILEDAKEELRAAFDRPPPGLKAASRAACDQRLPQRLRTNSARSTRPFDALVAAVDLLRVAGEADRLDEGAALERLAPRP